AKDELRLDAVGDGFLYKMVRTLVGTLLQQAEAADPGADDGAPGVDPASTSADPANPAATNPPAGPTAAPTTTDGSGTGQTPTSSTTSGGSTSSSPPGPPARYLSYDFDTVGAVTVAFHDEREVNVRSIAPQASWTYELVVDGPNAVRVTFTSTTDSQMAEFLATIVDGELQVVFDWVQ
ncbi:MAG: hypothetical protein GY773_00805, partial [Actinomycetia bacterium]|nr:hypothetical protein [Actinomycetes bacterium]